MNQVLLEPDEVDAAGTAVLRGRRAEHLRTVLQVAVGGSVRVGVRDGKAGSAEIVAADADMVQLRCTLLAAPPTSADVLLLAVPRPKVLLRILEHAAALGFSRVVLFRTWRVDKSHLSSQAMQPLVQRERLCRGLEQSCRTALPTVQFFPQFRPFVEDRLAGLGLPTQRFVAHPGAAQRTAALQLPADAGFALAIGPDGGFLPYEIDQLAGRGFRPISLGPHPLRTESAVSALHAQLDLLRQRG